MIVDLSNSFVIFFSFLFMSNFFNEFHLLDLGKHEHEFGNRLLRGMVDEFYMFDCPLPRLEILVLMHHCKIYWSK